MFRPLSPPAGNHPSPPPSTPSQPLSPASNTTKRKQRPTGTPDPEAEVVSLSRRALMGSDRYVCEICGQGFQRNQNLQMHRRRHKVPWRLLKRAESGVGEARKRVFVCPDPSCLHHSPAHALGDLVGIKKHYRRRKHSEHKQWACVRCSKAYTVQSDYEAHLKTCGTRGHSCDCGRVFSRVESFMEHQDTCNACRPEPQLSRSESSPSPSSDCQPAAHYTELQLLPTSRIRTATDRPWTAVIDPDEPPMKKLRLSMLRLSIGADSDRAAEETRREIETAAEMEFAVAKRVRLQAQAELNRMAATRDEATKNISSSMLEIKCLFNALSLSH